jgi:two-component system LytT family sensor kinase
MQIAAVNRRHSGVIERTKKSRRKRRILLIDLLLLLVDRDHLPAGCWRGRRTIGYLGQVCMKVQLNPPRVRLFAWMALAFLAIHAISYAVDYPSEFGYRVLDDFWRLLLIVVLHYIFFEYTIRYWNRRGWLLSLLLLLGHFFMWSAGLAAWRAIGIALHTYVPLQTYKSRGSMITAQMTLSMMTLLFFAIVRHLYDHYQLRQATQQLRIEKQEAELNYLKAQTNPHFLFNTLNNIYALTKTKSDAAPESVLRLSGILRFMLYEAGGNYIAVGQELKIIADYLELEKLRYDESLRVSLKHDVEDMGQAVPPLLLLPLVENAFKHGASETRGAAFVDIFLSIRARRLLFEVRNSADNEGPVQENIGLSNLRRQLQLLYTDYELTLHPGPTQFTARLTINLSSHV